MFRPDCKFYQNHQGVDGTTLAVGVDMVSQDLAIVEFDADSYRAQLAAAKIHPARLYDGTGYTLPLREAEIAGFGAFGFSPGPDLTETLQVHATLRTNTHSPWDGEL